MGDIQFLAAINTSLIGHLHPLLVHLPIGIFSFAFVISLFGAEKRKQFDAALSYALLSGAVSSLLACIAGYLLAGSGEYDVDLVQKHQWTGIATCALGFLAYFIANYRRPLVWITCIVMAVAGHLGGTLTHGEDYFFGLADEETTFVEKVLDSTVKIATEAPKADSITEKAEAPREISLYQDQVVGILQSKCYTCHSKIKKKGGLRLDSEEFIKQGGKNGAVLTAGDADNSKLYTHLLLPLEDEDHMPPKGKKQLSAAEIATIHRWVKMADPFAKTTVSTTAVKITESVPQAVEPPAPVEKPVAIIPTKTISIKPADPDNIDAIKKLNVVVTPIQSGSNGLSLNFVNLKNFNSKMLDQAFVLKEQVVKLKLTNQAVTDQDLQKIRQFNNLRQLQLEKTKVTDEGMDQIKSMQSLEQLNLYGTAISDKGLEKLTGCKNLKTLFLWKTNATAEGIAKLKQALPNLTIEAGGFSFKKPDSTKK
ncbi:MAG: hypothetical protein LW815_08375 [Chitinophagaceae bacterium]|nr:hypothetical protein [Chitinophagaceae bacterium]